jgi:flagellar basal-body rod modification protein FlgD
MVDAVNGSTDYANLGLGVPKGNTKKSDLGQGDFLTLMMTQLKNQDPFKPLDSGEFLGQIAQFGTVSGLQQLQTSFDGLKTSLVSNQALQAASLVGHAALVETSKMSTVDGQVVGGTVDLPDSTSSLTVTVRDATGQIVRTIPLGSHAAGQASFVWDGKTDGGADAPADYYTFNADYRSGSTMAAGTVSLAATIDSVKITSDGFNVELRGIGEKPFSSVHEISYSVGN